MCFVLPLTELLLSSLVTNQLRLNVLERLVAERELHLHLSFFQSVNANTLLGWRHFIFIQFTDTIACVSELYLAIGMRNQ